MLSNYLKIARRNLTKNIQYTLINVLGLSVALALCIVAYINHDYSYGYDAFHTDAERIIRVNSIRIVNGETQEWGITPMPLGPALAHDFANVETYMRLTEGGVVCRYENLVFDESLVFVDDNFFDVFNFPLIYGTPEAFTDPNSVVISEQTWIKYFGDEDPLGRQITLKYGEFDPISATVAGVAKKLPGNSSIQFDILTVYDNLRGDFEDWRRWGYVTFIRVTDPASIDDLSGYMEPYVAHHNAAHPDLLVTDFSFEPLTSMFLKSFDIRAYFLKQSMHPAAIVAPSIVAVLILLMACFNYMNTAIAYSGKRLKEIGLRKVMGSQRHQLVAQFMGESLLLCVAAFVLALVFAEYFVPAYSGLWPEVELVLDYGDNVPLLVFLGLLLLTAGILAGAYPAIYISGFNPIKIFRGRQQLGGSNHFTRVLLTLQLSIAVLTVIASFVFTNNARYQQSLDVGYDKDMVLGVWLGTSERYIPMRDALRQLPDVVEVAGTRHHIGYSWARRVAEVLEEKSEVQVFDVGKDYIETMGLRILQGRSFDAEMESDRASIIVNEMFVREFGWSDPLDQQVVIDSVRYHVIGVIENFYLNVWQEIEPALLRFVPADTGVLLIARVPGDQLVAANTLLRREWQRIVPDGTYDGFYQDEIMAESMLINNSIKTTFVYIGIIAVLIAATGLFSLVSLTIARRTKEIGIRKVLGASITGIGHLINRPFIIMLLIAALAASITAYFSLEIMLDSIFVYNSGVNLISLFLATILIFIVAFITTGTQVYRIAAANPVETIRYE